jgi:hypothetical protein
MNIMQVDGSKVVLLDIIPLQFFHRNPSARNQPLKQFTFRYDKILDQGDIGHPGRRLPEILLHVLLLPRLDRDLF